MNEINSSQNSTFPTHAGKAYETNAKTAASKEQSDPEQVREKAWRENARVTISDAVKDYAELKKAADSVSPPDNNAKILELKKKIQEGSYNINFDELSAKVLEKEFNRYEDS